MASQKWPSRLWIVRHGDVDTPLSPLGETQARALGAWFRALPVSERPSAVLSSPYLRSLRSAELIVDSAGPFPHTIRVVADERLREKHRRAREQSDSVQKAPRAPEVRKTLKRQINDDPLDGLQL